MFVMHVAGYKLLATLILHFSTLTQIKKKWGFYCNKELSAPTLGLSFMSKIYFWLQGQETALDSASDPAPDDALPSITRTMISYTAEISYHLKFEINLLSHCLGTYLHILFMRCDFSHSATFLYKVPLQIK